MGFVVLKREIMKINLRCIKKPKKKYLGTLKNDVIFTVYNKRFCFKTVFDESTVIPLLHNFVETPHVVYIKVRNWHETTFFIVLFT